MELLKGQKVKVTDSIGGNSHCFEIGNTVEFLRLHQKHDDWFVFKGTDKFDTNSEIEQSLVEDEFELI